MPRTPEEVEQIIDDLLDDLVAEADGDDETLLRLCGLEMSHIKTYTARIEDVRDAAATRLRATGLPMTKIAALARVSDSYLSRRLFKTGVPRKVLRQKPSS